MRIKFYGQSAFGITAANGTRIITDPYTPEHTGYWPIRDTAQIVVTSNATDISHCRHDLVPGDHVWVNALEVAESGKPREVLGITFHGCPAMEIETHPYHDPEANAMYKFEVDGMMIAHMGDIGMDLTDEQVDFLRGVDILLTMAGAGGFVVSLDEVDRVIREVKPKLVIPKHFRTLAYRPRNMEWIEAFLSYWDDSQIDFAFECEIDITRHYLPAETRVMCLDYARA